MWRWGIKRILGEGDNKIGKGLGFVMEGNVVNLSYGEEKEFWGMVLGGVKLFGDRFRRRWVVGVMWEGFWCW